MRVQPRDDAVERRCGVNQPGSLVVRAHSPAGSACLAALRGVVLAALEERRDQRQHDDHRDDRQQVLVDVVGTDRVAEQVAEQADADRPERRADDVRGRRTARCGIWLAPASIGTIVRTNGMKRASTTARRAAAVEELLRPLEVLGLEEPGVGLEQARAEARADPVADLRAEHRGDERADEHDRRG